MFWLRHCCCPIYDKVSITKSYVLCAYGNVCVYTYNCLDFWKSLSPNQPPACMHLLTRKGPETNDQIGVALSDNCIAPMRVTTALVFDPVGRLMQLLRAPQILASLISGCGCYAARKGSVRWSRPLDEATDPQTTKSYKAREAALSTKLGFQLQLSLLYYQHFVL